MSEKMTFDKALCRFLEFYNKAKKAGKDYPIYWAWMKTGEWIHRYEKRENNEHN